MYLAFATIIFSPRNGGRSHCPTCCYRAVV